LGTSAIARPSNGDRTVSTRPVALGTHRPSTYIPSNANSMLVGVVVV
jgi:hypothetical protein